MVPWIHQRGKDWGRYSARINGWPKTSLMYRIWEEGSVGAAIKQHSRSVPVQFMPPEIADFDRVVRTMDDHVRAVVEVIYRSKAGRNQKAEALGLSKSRMYQILDFAHGYLAARLNIRPSHLSNLSTMRGRQGATSAPMCVPDTAKWTS